MLRTGVSDRKVRRLHLLADSVGYALIVYGPLRPASCRPASLAGTVENVRENACPFTGSPHVCRRFSGDEAVLPS